MIWPFVLIGGIAALALAGSGSDYRESSNRIRFRLPPGEKRSTQSILCAGTPHKIVISGTYWASRWEEFLFLFRRRRWRVADAFFYTSRDFSLDEKPQSRHFDLAYCGLMLDGQPLRAPFVDHEHLHEYWVFHLGQDQPLSLELQLPSWAVDSFGELRVEVEPLSAEEQALVPELVAAKKAEEVRRREAAAQEERIRQAQERRRAEDEWLRAEAEAANRAWQEENERLKREAEEQRERERAEAERTMLLQAACMWQREQRMEFWLEPGREIFTPVWLEERVLFNVVVKGASITRSYLAQRRPLAFDGTVIEDEPIETDWSQDYFAFCYVGKGKPLSILDLQEIEWVILVVLRASEAYK